MKNIVRERLKKALKDLRDLGYYAKMETKYDTVSAPDDSIKHVVVMKEDIDGNQLGRLWLDWAGDWKEILQVLAKHDVPVAWTGYDTDRIKVITRIGE